MIRHSSHTPTALHLMICFEPSGEANFFPEGDGSEIAARFAQLVKLFHENPHLIVCAAGAPHGPGKVQ